MAFSYFLFSPSIPITTFFISMFLNCITRALRHRFQYHFQWWAMKSWCWKFRNTPNIQLIKCESTLLPSLRGTEINDLFNISSFLSFIFLFPFLINIWRFNNKKRRNETESDKMLLYDGILVWTDGMVVADLLSYQHTLKKGLIKIYFQFIFMLDIWLHAFT